MTTVDAIIKWTTSNESVDLFYMSKDSNLLEEFLARKPKNIGKVILSVQMNNFDAIMKKYPKNVVDSSQINRPFVMFNDYEGTHVIMSNNELSYSDTIEWNPVFRKFCKRIMNYRYTGSKIIDGYWSDENIETHDNIRFLKISKWGDMCQKLPVPDARLSLSDKVFDTVKSSKYIEDLKHFIKSFFTILLEDEEDTEDIIESLLTKESMTVWVRAFIHITQNASYNNDSLEHRGDRVFHGDFGRYMHDKFPNINSHEASSFVHQYLSKKYQKIWSDDLYLIDRLIKNPIVERSPKTKTDCIEAFIGAADEVASNAQNGLNYVMLSKLLYTLFDSVPFNKELKFGIPKHKIVQINESLGYKKNDLIVAEVQKGTDAGGDFSYLVSQVVNPALREFYNHKTIESSIAGNTPLTDIYDGHVTFKYYHGKISSEDAHNEVWNIISAIYDSYDISLTTIKNKPDSIFDKIKRYEPTFYNELTSTLFAEFPEVNNDLLLFNFIVNNDENFVIFSMRKQNTESKVNANMSEDYLSDHIGSMQYKNISVVPFIYINYKLGNIVLSTIESSKYNALRSYYLNRTV